MSYKVIITGGNGFVGKYLAEEIKSSWDNVEIISWDLPDVDITDFSTYEEQLRLLQPDWIVHLAALANVGDSFKNPDLFYFVNAEGTKSLLEKIKEVSPNTKVLVISSADIYGMAGSSPISEKSLSELKPLNPYAKSKALMEKIIEDKYNDFCIRVRPFPHIGPGQKKGFVTADFAFQIASIEAGLMPPVIKVGNLESQRDFTDVRDVVKAYRLLMEKGRTGEVYNVASGEARSIESILEKLLTLSSVDIDIEKDLNKMRPSDNPILVGDSTKLREATRWQPVISLEKSLEDILNYWRSKNN